VLAEEMAFLKVRAAEEVRRENYVYEILSTNAKILTMLERPGTNTPAYYKHS
jgi:hypothetical protein